ncbi:fibrinogen-related protein [Elysia marginata]|uniref:Fibrinogen-related protein n=1 Tax=Elysia marginata TaxID=1093978 RepID=A0AAV4J333_9GAST|nr:fibrinogen-related protein [Elysia marginata]
MSLSLTPGVALLVCISIFCVTHLEAKTLKFKARAGEVDYKTLNSHDATEHKDCGSLLRAGYNVSGVYRLTLNKSHVMMPCEFKDGNAFTVILRRVNHSVTFAQPWSAYEGGFGDPQGNFWAGLANIFHLTNSGSPTGLQINMQDWDGVNQNVLYRHFLLDNRETRYRLYVGGYQGSLADDLQYHNQMPFSTYDAPDPHGCAANMYAGFWYNYCAYSLPTGRYYNTPYYTPTGSMYNGIFYKDWHNYNYSLKYVSWTISSYMN